MLIEEAPKYGNDNDEVDQLVVDAYASYIDEMKKYPNTRYGRRANWRYSLCWNILYFR